MFISHPHYFEVVDIPRSIRDATTIIVPDSLLELHAQVEQELNEARAIIPTINSSLHPIAATNQLGASLSRCQHGDIIGTRDIAA